MKNVRHAMFLVKNFKKKTAARTLLFFARDAAAGGAAGEQQDQQDDARMLGYYADETCGVDHSKTRATTPTPLARPRLEATRTFAGKC